MSDDFVNVKPSNYRMCCPTVFQRTFTGFLLINEDSVAAFLLLVATSKCFNFILPSALRTIACKKHVSQSIIWQTEHGRFNFVISVFAFIIDSEKIVMKKWDRLEEI